MRHWVSWERHAEHFKAAWLGSPTGVRRTQKVAGLQGRTSFDEGDLVMILWIVVTATVIKGKAAAQKQWLTAWGEGQDQADSQRVSGTVSEHARESESDR